MDPAFTTLSVKGYRKIVLSAMNVGVTYLLVLDSLSNEQEGPSTLQMAPLSTRLTL